MSQVRGYQLPIFIRQTAASIAGVVVWSMRNLGPGTQRRPLYLRRFQVNVMFDGTPAASQAQYQLKRFRTATPTAGTAVTVVKQNTDDGATVVTDARFLDTGLTVAGVVSDAPIMTMGGPRALGSTWYGREWPGMLSAQGSGALIIKPDDGLLIDLGQAAVIGDGIQGWMEWDEVGGNYTP